MIHITKASEEKIAKNGQPFKFVDYKDEVGEDKATCWKRDYPDYDKVVTGADLAGVIRVDGQYKNLVATLEPPKFVQNRGAGMAKAQETKAKYIEQAQGRKNDAIAYFNALNSAIALYKASVPFESDEEIQAFIVKWRTWFLAEWERNENPYAKN